MRRTSQILLSCALFLLFALARAAAPPSPRQLLEVAATFAETGPGSGTLAIGGRIASGWHVNSHKPSEEYLIPTTVELDPNPAISAGEPRYPEGKLVRFAFADKPLSVYEERFRIEIPISWEKAAPASLSGVIKFQACNDRQCLAPAFVKFETTGLARGSSSLPPRLSGGAVPLSRGATAGASQDFEEIFTRRGILFVLALLFVGGLALNLTPCVYPVIPLTVGFFGGQSGGQNRRTFGLAALYVLGMAAMYSALGVAAALSGKLFGAALQSPWLLAGVALVLVALALSMFGLYDLRVPSSLMQKAGARSGAVGAFAMGLLVGIIAAPCVGPFVLGLLAFVAARQSAPLGFLLFFVLSLGLGLPYLFLAAFSGSLSRLPRAGEWMEGVKRIFGWVLIAMAAYFARTTFPASIRDWLLPIVLLVGAIALGVSARALRPPLRFVAAMLFLASALFFRPRTALAGPDWRPYTDKAVAAVGRPAVIDFSASWCLPCVELDEKTFSDPHVREALMRRALFKADLTRSGSSESVALSQKYEILGVPTVIFLDATGQERKDLRLVGFEGPELFLARLAKAP